LLAHPNVVVRIIDEDTINAQIMVFVAASTVLGNWQPLLSPWHQSSNNIFVVFIDASIVCFRHIFVVFVLCFVFVKVLCMV